MKSILLTVLLFASHPNYEEKRIAAEQYCWNKLSLTQQQEKHFIDGKIMPARVYCKYIASKFIDIKKLQDNDYEEPKPSKVIK